MVLHNGYFGNLRDYCILVKIISGIDARTTSPPAGKRTSTGSSRGQSRCSTSDNLIQITRMPATKATAADTRCCEGQPNK